MSLSMPAAHTTFDANLETRAGSASDHDQPLFSGEELRQFASDDVEAGRRIGKILSALFIYTLLAMSIATWWTFRTVAH